MLILVMVAPVMTPVMPAAHVAITISVMKDLLVVLSGPGFLRALMRARAAAGSRIVRRIASGAALLGQRDRSPEANRGGDCNYF